MVTAEIEKAAPAAEALFAQLYHAIDGVRDARHLTG